MLKKGKKDKSVTDDHGYFLVVGIKRRKGGMGKGSKDKGKTFL